jgi:S1-C subfamily serine protease
VDEALLVLHVEANAPAAAAGILVGDLLLSVDGQPVHSVHSVQHQISSLKVGDPVAVVVLRGGVKMDLKVILADRG